MRSIRGQLTRKLLRAVLLIQLGGLVALYFGARDAAIDQFDRTVHAKALAISTLTHQTSAGVRCEFSDRFLEGFEDDKPRDYFQLWTKDGREIARSESLPRGINLPRRGGRANDPDDWNITLPNGRPGRANGYFFRPNARDPQPRGRAPELYLVVASDRSELEETLWKLLGLSTGWCVLLIGATLWVIPRVLRTELRPLDDLGAQAAKIDITSLSTRLGSSDLPNELRPIAEKLNEVFARLQLSFERERRFSADLAHELRTPLAELRAMSESAIKWPESRDPDQDHEVLAVAKQMERIVTHILALVRSEQGQLHAQLETVALAPLVAETWNRFAPRAAEKNLKVAIELAPADAPVDHALLRAILNNLFDNAVDYTPADGAIAIEIRAEQEGPCIQVANSTADLEASDVTRMFDRFWRKESARSGGLHVGLGLSLSKAFAEAMGWTLDATFSTGRWITFQLQAPSAHQARNRDR